MLFFAVLEQLRDPCVALWEITRVRRPGGLYLGTVSQGEPFHASYFHHTAWGLLSLFSSQPELAPRKARWPRKALQVDALYRAGSIGFVLRRR